MDSNGPGVLSEVRVPILQLWDICGFQMATEFPASRRIPFHHWLPLLASYIVCVLQLSLAVLPARVSKLGVM